MNTIIIEDEKPAAEKLRKAIERTNRPIQVYAVLDSIDAAVTWLLENPAPDLVFMDIELGDGLSFKIFEKVRFNSPVIFCTAYDEYWQEAFEHSSIDYLLKPVKQEKLDNALNKYDKLKLHFAANFQQLQQWHRHPSGVAFKKRFLVKRGLDYISIKTDDIAYFFAAHKVVCIVDNRNQKYIIDQSLGEIEKQVDPANFFRVNRKYLIQQNAIRKIKSFPKSKLMLELEPAIGEDIIISHESVSAFKEWMGQ